MRYLDIGKWYLPGIVKYDGVSGLNGLSGLGQLVADPEEAERIVTEGRQWINEQIELSLEPTARLQTSLQMLKDGRVDIEDEWPLIIEQTNLLNQLGEGIVDKAIELLDLGVIDKPQADAIFDAKIRISTLISDITAKANEYRRFRDLPLLSRILSEWAHDSPEFLGLLQAASNALHSVVAAVPKIPKAAGTLLDILPWAIGGAVLLGVVGAVRGRSNPPRRKRRRRGRRKDGLEKLLPLALVGGGAYLVLTAEKKPRVPVVTEIIPTVPAEPIAPIPPHEEVLIPTVPAEPRIRAEAPEAGAFV